MQALPTLSALRRRRSSDHTTAAATAIFTEKRGMELAQHFVVVIVSCLDTAVKQTQQNGQIPYLSNISFPLVFSVNCHSKNRLPLDNTGLIDPG